jgi:hypothetical protein
MSTPTHGAPDGAGKPYKGPESYATEDADLFFGRERTGEQLVAAILSSTFTVLHAPSGAGKTSLLNARAIPALESRGWYPVRALAHDDPSESVRLATVEALLPSPSAEAEALRRALAELAPAPAPCTLGVLRARYGALHLRDPRRRRLIAPVAPAAEHASTRWGGGRVTPFFCRLLRGSLDLEAFRAQLHALAPAGSPPPEVSDAADAAALAATLSGDAYAAAHAGLLDDLSVPVPGLLPFFENLTEVWARRNGELNVVLLLDQFEELFTRFVDTGPEPRRAGPPSPDWRLRAAFFEDLRALNASVRQRDCALLPLRFVISMREEFLARLAPLRSFVDEGDLFSFGLGFLDRKDAAVALGKPAEHYGYRYAPECFEDILSSLTRENRFVEPAKLQIVCERLWTERGRALATSAGAGEGGTGDGERPGALPEVEARVYRELGGVAGILGLFFHEFLEAIPDADDRFETLDLLAPLITAGRTRNIVEHDQLVNVRYRHPEVRRRLLEQMRTRSLVRIEERNGGLFVEITHEFLIEPMLAAVAREQLRDERENRFRFALRTLERAHDDARADATLAADEFAALDRARGRIRWEAWAVELMFRSALRCGDPSAVVYWARRYAAESSPDPALLWAALHDGRGVRRVLSMEELRVLGDEPPGGTASPDVSELIFRSLIAHGRTQDRDRIRHWAQRMVTTHAS